MHSPRVGINASWMHPKFTLSVETTDGSPSVMVGSKFWNELQDCEAKRNVELLHSAIKELNDRC